MAELLSEEKFEEGFETVLKILNTIGVEFDSKRVLEIFKNNGFKIVEKRVFFTRGEIEGALSRVPKIDYSHLPEAKRYIKASTVFGTVPTIYDVEEGIHRPSTVDDVIKSYKMMNSSDMYGVSHISVCDPIDNDSQDKYISQYAMMLKYSQKDVISNGIRATLNPDDSRTVYEIQREAFALMKEFYSGEENLPVLRHSICPMSPLSYDSGALDILTAVIDEGLVPEITPCTLSGMTGPYNSFGVAIHDMSIALSGVVLTQIMNPGMDLSIGGSSAISDLRTMQPMVASPESISINCMIYEFYRYLGISSGVGGAFADSGFLDFQAGSEAFMTAVLPFYISDIDVVACNCGHLATHRSGCFEKIIYDEENINYINRLLDGVNMNISENLIQELQFGVDNGNFFEVLESNTLKEYRKDNYMPKIFSKGGISEGLTSKKTNIELKARAEVEKRIESYVQPVLTDRQIRLIEEYLPSECRED